MIQILNKQNIDDTSNEVQAYLVRVQPKPIFPKFILIKNKGESPPGRSRSSGSNLERLNNLSLQPVTATISTIKSKLKK